MPIVFACAASHAPGMTAWTEAAPKEQADRFLGSYRKLGEMLATSNPDALVAITVEHWANFFLDHMPAFCIGRSDHYDGPVEEWLNISKARVPGDAQLSADLLDASLDGGFDPTFSDELLFDHATMLPLHFLNPNMAVPVTPVILNALTPPMPTPKRCFAFGQLLGKILERSQKRIAVIATGGLSHWPGEAKHGKINVPFDKKFLNTLTRTNRSLSKQAPAVTKSGHGLPSPARYPNGRPLCSPMSLSLRGPPVAAWSPLADPD
jgi:2,3-dihydroxyphenylpropionate 1,2-dioxygenase